jgi:hypothetical protein
MFRRVVLPQPLSQRPSKLLLHFQINTVKRHHLLVNGLTYSCPSPDP